ncbi:MAG: TRAP transporter substrate-binding protein [Bdellovibrionales bacterium]|nr:TRAP transporter substrate-binding protein [Bdellovibrionales bacterium]
MKNHKNKVWRTLGLLSILLTLHLGSMNALAKEETKKGKYEIKWLLAHDPVSLFVEAANFFAREVEKRTNGEINVSILTTQDINLKDHNLTQVYNKKYKIISPDQVIQMLMNGDVEMTQTYTTSLGKYENKLWILDLPYLFRDHNHATKVLDGKIGEQLLAGLGKSNMKGLAFTYSGGFRILPTNGREIRKMEDFKGLRVGTSGSPVAKAVFEKLGGLGVSMPLVKGHEMTKKGLIEGIETTYPRLYSMHQNEVSKVMNDTKHSLFLTSIVVNQTFYKGLPQHLQKVVKEVAKEAAVLERNISIEDGIKTKERCKKDGFKVVELPVSEQQRIKKAVAPLHKKFKNIFDEKIISEIESIN